jgi:hypothetical protein
MSSKPVKLEIKNKCPGQVSKGLNTQVWMDGKQLPYVKSVTYKCFAGDMAEVTLEMFVDVSIETNIDKKRLKIKTIPMVKINNKTRRKV